MTFNKQKLHALNNSYILGLIDYITYKTELNKLKVETRLEEVKVSYSFMVEL